MRRPLPQFLTLFRLQSLRRRLLLGFVAPLSITALVALSSGLAVQTTAEGERALMATEQTIFHAQELAKFAVDAETAQRGFVITGDEQFLQPFEAARAGFPRVSQQLQDGLEGQPHQLAVLAELRALFERWNHAFAEPTLRTRRQTPSELANATEQVYSSVLAARVHEQRFLRSPSEGELLRWQQAVDFGRERLGHQREVSARSATQTGWRDTFGLFTRYETTVHAYARGKATLAEVEAVGAELASAAAANAMSTLMEEEECTGAAITGEGKAIIDQLRAKVAELVRVATASQNAQLERGAQAARWTTAAMVLGPAIGLALSVLLALALARGVSRSAEGVATAARSLSEGHLSERVEVRGHDELARAGQDFNRMADALQLRDQQGTAFNRMGELLQSCLTVTEAGQVLEKVLPRLFPGAVGGVFLINASRNLVEPLVSWGLLRPPPFTLQACWALRGSRAHLVADASSDVVCAHASAHSGSVLCLPLVAQGELLGVLHLSVPQAAAVGALRPFADQVAEHVALALGNLRLREALRNQAIRDGLTGLFNRRYLEESVVREIEWARRNHRPFGVLFFDVDHFKRFNDTYGHDGGDALLREVGQLIRGSFRGEDIPCRYGGEEFVVVLRDASFEDTVRRAEALRAAVKAMRVTHQGRPLGEVSISVGVAVFPDHGEDSLKVIKAADQALYRAKNSGRDRVCVAGDDELAQLVAADDAPRKLLEPLRIAG